MVRGFSGGNTPLRRVRYFGGAVMLSLSLVLAGCGEEQTGAGEQPGVTQEEPGVTQEEPGVTQEEPGEVGEAVPTVAATVEGGTEGTTETGDLGATEGMTETGDLGGTEAGEGQFLEVAEVTGNVEQYSGQTVTVAGEVEDVWADGGAFKLDDESLLEGGIDNDLIVVWAGGAGMTGGQSTEGVTGTTEMTGTTDTGTTGTTDTARSGTGEVTLGDELEDDWVVVSGTIRLVTVAEIEQEVGFDLDPEIEAEIEDQRPVLVAQSVTRAPENAMQGGQEGVGGGATTEGAAGDALSVAAITGNRAQYTGQEVTVVGEVEDVRGTEFFKLDDEALFAGGIDDDLLVLRSGDAGSQVAIDELDGEYVRVTGTVREVDQALVDELGVQFDENMLQSWQGRLALVATSVERAQQ